MTLARILTVDDSASIRLTINVTLSNAGYSVVEASDGAEGLAAAQQDVFDLIITDLNMPGMDGLQMIEAIRKQPIGAGVPIIFLSTESDGDVKAQAKAAGATGG
jgi:two-component system chemotaxis response regulator CheY